MPSPAANFFAGLANGFGQSLLRQQEEDEQENRRAKEQDYELLMAAFKQMQPDLTPSQARLFMEKSVDIWKPKGGKGLKEKLAELFEKGQTYQPQSGRILSEVGAIPRMIMPGQGTETITLPDVPVGPSTQVEGMPLMPEMLRTGGIIPGGTAEMPKPPVPEMTYRERELQDDITKDVARQKAMTDRQLLVDKERAKERSTLETQKFNNRLKALDATARNRELLKVKQRARQIAVNPENPTADEIAEAQRQLNDENDQKQQLVAARIGAIESNEQYKRDLIAQGWARIEAGLAALTDNRRRTWSDSQYKRLRTEIEAKNNEIDRITGLFRSSNATPEILEGYQKEVQKLIVERDAKVLELDQKLGSEGEQYFPYQSPQGVPLPRGGSPAPRKSTSVKLTEAEIRAAGGTDADVAEARRKGVLAQ